MDYAYRGARTLVLLHERRMREFVDTWAKARSSRVALPTTDNPTYRSYETLLHHVLNWSREYMVWICEKLDLPNPGIDPVPSEGTIATELHDYLHHLLERWRLPLSGVPKAAFYDRVYTARWDVDYCIDAMLEHAVMHPERHGFQLSEILEGTS